MHKLRNILLFLLMFILSGCSVVYNLDISDDKIVESSNFYIEEDDYNLDIEDSPSSFDDIFRAYYSQDYRAFIYDFDDDSLYKKSRLDDNVGSGINLKYVYNYDNFKNSYLLNYRYSKNSFITDDEFVIIDYDDLSVFFQEESSENFNSLIVNIKTDLKVIKNNADKVSGNLYTWKIDKDSDKSIYMKIKRSIDYGSYLPIVGTLILIGGIIVVIVFYIKRKIDNKDHF